MKLINKFIKFHMLKCCLIDLGLAYIFLTMKSYASTFYKDWHPINIFSIVTLVC